jgi:hypothetical protein
MTLRLYILPLLVGARDKIFCNQMGDNNTTYTNYQFDGNSELTQIELRHEIEKKTLLLAERDKQIAHLEEIIRLLKDQLEMQTNPFDNKN